MRYKSALLLALLAAPCMHAFAGTLTTDGGAPVGDNQNSQTVGEHGPVLLQDFHLIEKLARFDRERIPERVVHARGTGAHGVFESYGDFSSYTKASFLQAAHKQTPVFVRFSTVVHSAGSPETKRDPRGFAVKFYTDQGNYDLVGNNLPVFFIRDAMKFPDMVHAFKPSPVYNKQDQGRVFDFLSHQPESTNMLTYLYSDLGTPASYRKTNGFGVHAFKWINAKGQARYVKYTWTSLQGVENLTAQQADDIGGKNQENLTQDLYTNLKAGNFPSWELSVQMLAPENLGKFDFDPLDPTKIWPEKLVPSVKIGKMTLNRVPDNFFEETEQAAFDPGVLVPGIEASEDRLLQGRLFSYGDTQRYRIGANYQQLPINHAKVTVDNQNQAGSMNAGHTVGETNYEPSVNPTAGENPQFKYARGLYPNAIIQQEGITKTNDYKQAGDLYRTYTDLEKDHLISNMVGDLGQVTNPDVVYEMVSHFYKADADYGTRLAKQLNLDLARIQGRAQKL
jgi:catalase